MSALEAPRTAEVLRELRRAARTPAEYLRADQYAYSLARQEDRERARNESLLRHPSARGRS